MNWMVAESAAFHGGSCEDDAAAEAEAAAFAEYQRRARKGKAPAEPVHADASSAMAAEHRKMREREEQRRVDRLEHERKENELSAVLVGNEYRLPPEVSGHILSKVGEPTGNRAFDYTSTHQALTEAEHGRREQLRAGVNALEKRVDGYTNELVGNGMEQRWEDLQAVSAQEAKDLVNHANSQVHAMENKAFVQMYRS